MREIKFRAWDKNNNCWVDDVLLACNNPGYLYQNYNKCEFMGEDRNIVLMQYTGLKDKNGVEIYEGDIVNSWANHKAPNNFYKREVIWYECGLEFKPLTGTTLCKNNAERGCFEVIGNIYESEELMEGD